MFNVLGYPIDGKAPLEGVPTHAIHAQSPPIGEQSIVTTSFVTGIKAIDLMVPYPQGGKIGLFGGTGVDESAAPEEVIQESGPVGGETVEAATGKSPWDRLQSEYGIFESPFGRETVMLDGV